MRRALLALPLALAACAAPDYAASCDRYGFQRGTPEFARCVMDLERDHRAEALQSLRDGIRAMEPAPPPPPIWTPAPSIYRR